MTEYRSRWIVLAMLLVVLTGCSPGQQVESPVEAGLDSEDGRLAEFIGEKLRAARDRPDSGLRRGELGIAYDANGFQDAAVQSYRQAVQLDPGDYRWAYFLALSLAAVNNLEEAKTVMASAMAIDPGYAPAHLYLGDWLMDTGEPEMARVSFEQAEQLAVDSATLAASESGQARAYLQLGEANRAVTLLEGLVRRYEHDSIVRLLGSAYRRSGRPEAAATLPELGSEEKIRWPDPRQRIKRQYVKGFSGRMLLAENYLEEERFSDALPLLEVLREERPEDESVLNNLSVAYRALGRADDARALLMTALTLYPDSQMAHYNMAVVHEQTGDTDLALDHLNRAISLAPAVLAPHRRKVALLVSEQQYDTAMEALIEAAQVAEGDVDLLFYRGMVAGALERWQDAIDDFRQTLALAPGHRRAKLFLARSYIEAGQFDEADQALAEAAESGVSETDYRSAALRLRELRSQRQ